MYMLKAISKNGDSQSPFGKNIISLLLYLRSKGGLSVRTIKTLFSNYYGIKT